MSTFNDGDRVALHSSLLYDGRLGTIISEEYVSSKIYGYQFWDFYVRLDAVDEHSERIIGVYESQIHLISEYPVRLDVPGPSVLMWARQEEIEETALKQLREVAQLPGLHGLRVMPDVHWGNGATVGSVIAMEQALAPAAVGVDIGCGVNAVKTNIKLEDLSASDLVALRHRFENAVPVGFNSHQIAGKQLSYLGNFGAETSNFLDTLPNIQMDLTVRKKDGSVSQSNDSVRERAAHQLGTLGGGNHFIELCSDSENWIWITLHSGSRNIGMQLALKHIDVAMKDPRNKDLPPHLKELSMFYKGTPEMDAYLHDLNWAQEFAMRSRTVMMKLIQHELEDYFDDRNRHVEFGSEINCHHNYVSVEKIDKFEMIVTRKGAISAKKGELALIPGSMATGSYIVRGLGNPIGFQSASHGAGRRMSRGAAKKAFTQDDLKKSMVGIEFKQDGDFVDEITHAYKDLDSVIAAESDLVEVVQKLDTILCVKG